MKKKETIRGILGVLIILLCLAKTTDAADQCVDAWEADLTDLTLDLCPVKTTSSEPCQFPFVDSGVTYRTCTVNGANNPDLLPRCKTASGAWAVCLVPTDAVVYGVTTRKGGSFSVNGASLEGGTLLWITGKSRLCLSFCKI